MISSLGFFKAEQELKHTWERNLCAGLYLELFTQIFTAVLPTLISMIAFVFIFCFSVTQSLLSFQSIPLSLKTI